ncbi:MAG: hypothetical protein ACKO0W_02405 [Planctomycetota bacterium]
MSAVPDDPFERNLDAFLGPQAGRRTLVLVGHLPVMSGLWLSQYADRVARDRGAVCMLRLEHDAVTLEVLRANGRRPAVRPQATLAEAMRAVATAVTTWMVVPRANDAVEIPTAIEEITILTGADEPAVVSAYRLVKSCVESSAAAGAILPPISVAVLGADDEECARVAEKLDKTTRAFLHVDLPVRGGLQRVAPVESTFRGTFDAEAPKLAQILAMIAEAERTAPAAQPAVAATSAAPFATERGDRFAPRAERRPPRIVRPDDAPTDARARSLAPSVAPSLARAAESLPPRGVRGAPFAHDDSALDSARAVLAGATRTMAEAARRLRDRDEAEAVSAAPAAPSAEPARTSDRPAAVSIAPAPALPVRARIVEGGLPQRLVPEIEGLVALPFAPPRIAGVELAVDAEGALHLVGRFDDLANLHRARAWARDHAEILALAHPGLRAGAAIALDVVVTNPADAVPLEGAQVHLLSLVEVAGRRGYLRQALPA